MLVIAKDSEGNGMVASERVKLELETRRGFEVGSLGFSNYTLDSLSRNRFSIILSFRCRSIFSPTINTIFRKLRNTVCKILFHWHVHEFQIYYMNT